jgi:hypothetical protein
MDTFARQKIEKLEFRVSKLESARTTEDASHTDLDGEQVVSRKLFDAFMELYEVNKGKCNYDHHGYCQAHYLHDNPCPLSVIADELAKQGRVGAPVAGG